MVLYNIERLYHKYIPTLIMIFEIQRKTGGEKICYCFEGVIKTTFF